MTSIQAGDVVVCVDDSQCRVYPYPGAEFTFKRGDVLRVRRVGRPNRYGLVGLFFMGRRRGYGAERFRKIEKADDAFTRQIRALKSRDEAAGAPPSPAASPSNRSMAK